MTRNKFSFILLLFYMVIQIILVLFFPLPFTSDSAANLLFAQAALQENTYYPNPSSLYSVAIIAPVYINYLIVLLKVSNGPAIIFFSNILLNTLQLILLFKVTEKIFDTRAAIVAGFLYVLYLSNLGLIFLNLTELPFGILILTSLYLYISSPSLRNGLLCGFTIGLAIGVRPTAWGLILAILIVYIIQVFQHKPHHWKMAGIVMGIMIYIIPMGLLSKQNIGRFEFTSATGPANLIMSANPRAKGVFDPHILIHDSIYLSKKTYVEKNEYLLDRSIEYIRGHPWHWISLIPRKFYSTFISDGWAIPQLLHSPKWDLNVYLKGNEEIKKDFHKEVPFFRITFWVLNIWQQAIYGILFVFFICQLYSFVRGKHFTYEALIINLFIVSGIGLTILAAVGSPRYKYNFVIVGIVLVSPLIADFLKKIIYHIYKGIQNLN